MNNMLPLAPAICLAIVLLFLAVERIMVRRWRDKILLRIHVTGIRGKSSVTEYIAAALRADSRSTLAKITGIRPTIINPDGKHQIIRRWGAPRINEQWTVLRKAAKNKVSTLVLECMSIAPELQKIESDILKPHIVVLTNIRDDHREQLGKSMEEQVEAICSSLPHGAIIVTAESLYRRAIEREARVRKSIVLFVESSALQNQLTLPDGVHPENVALAEMVCRLVDMPVEKARTAIIDYILTQQDSHRAVEIEGKNIHLINGFAVNDVSSAEQFIERWKKNLDHEKPIIIVFNTRSDRPLRSLQFADWLARYQGVKTVLLTGSHVSFVKRRLMSKGFPPTSVAVLKRNQLESWKLTITPFVKENDLIFGLGNIAGAGFEIVDSMTSPISMDVHNDT